MNDLIERLRQPFPLATNGPYAAALCREAADEIEKLMREVENLRDDVDQRLLESLGS